MTEEQAWQEFWGAWPKKVKRQAARDAFHWAWANHYTPDGELLEAMLETIAWQRVFYEGPQFLPDPNRWLLDCRWEDEDPNVAIAREREADRERQREVTRRRNETPDMAATRERDWHARKARA